MEKLSRGGLMLSCKAAFSSRQFLALNSILFISLLLVFYFPSNTISEKFLLGFCAYFLLPFTFSFFVLKDSVKKYGLCWGKFGILFNIFIFFLSTCLFLALSWGFLTVFDAKEVFLSGSQAMQLRKSFSVFLSSILILTWFIALKEIFFRGFFLLLWKRFLGVWSLVMHLVVVGCFSFAELSIFNVDNIGITMLLIVFWSGIASIVVYLTESVFLSFSFSFFSAILALVFSMIFK